MSKLFRKWFDTLNSEEQQRYLEYLLVRGYNNMYNFLSDRL